MINQFEVSTYLQDSFPSITNQLNDNCRYNAFAAMQALLDYTTAKIKAHRLNDVKQCFAVAERLFLKGNNNVKNAVVNIYVYSFSRLTQLEAGDTDKLLGLIPGTLYSEYIRQLQAA